jgi:beta-glucanase (GH16 family)
VRITFDRLLFACVALLGCAEPAAHETPASAEPALDASSPASDGARRVGLDAAVTATTSPRDAQSQPVADNTHKPDAAVADATTSAAPDAGTRAGWKLVWSDEFEGAQSASPDSTKWGFDVGGSGWGNQQLEYDTARPENASLSGHGELVLTARKESYMGNAYTSARLQTKGKFEHAYGRFEARMKLPEGKGIWPAFWLLGADIDKASWPNCGEIDIMENIGREGPRVYGTLHGPGYSGGASIGKPYDLPSGASVSKDFHVYAIEWEDQVVRWYVDDVLFETRTPKDLPAKARWVYDHPFFIILNLAVGGQWPGNPDANTRFPQQLVVDYVRVYERG